MPTQMPARVDPARLARSGARLRGRLELAKLERLAGQCAAAPRGEASIDLGFGADEGGRPLIEGTVQASIPVVCQRCLAVMELTLAAEVKLCAVRDPHEAPAEGFEPLEVDGETVETQALIEDELLLALPAAPTHPAGRCAAPGEHAPPPAAREAASPFAGLREMIDEQER